MSVGLFQLLFIALVFVVLFGRGRISETMGDFGKGVTRFRRGLDTDEAAGSRFEAAVSEAKAAEHLPAADNSAG